MDDWPLDTGIRHVKDIVRKQKRQAARCNSLHDEDSHAFYDMPLRVMRSLASQPPPAAPHSPSHHCHDCHKDKHHHHHRHHHHCHSHKAGHVPIRLCLNHSSISCKDTATQTSFEAAKMTASRRVLQPVPRSQTREDDRYPVFTRKVVSLIDKGKDRIRQTSTTRLNGQQTAGSTTVRSSSCPRTQTASYQPRPAIRSKSIRSFTNLPKDKLNDLLFIATVQRQEDEVKRQEEEMKCRKNKPYDVGEIHDYMKNKELLKKLSPVKDTAAVTQKEKPYDPAEIRKFIDEKRKQQRELQQREQAVKQQQRPTTPSSRKTVVDEVTNAAEQSQAAVDNVVADEAIKIKKSAAKRTRALLGEDPPIATEKEVKQILSSVLTKDSVPEIQLSKLADLPPADLSFQPKEITFTLFDQIADRRNMTFNQSMLTSNYDSRDILSKLSFDVDSKLPNDTHSSLLSDKAPEVTDVEKERHQDTQIHAPVSLLDSLLDQDKSGENTSVKSWSGWRPEELNKTVDKLIAEGLRRERQSFEKLIEEALSNSLFKGETRRDGSLHSSLNSSSNNSPTCESLPLDESLSDSLPKHSNIRPLDRNSSNVSVYVQHDPSHCISCICGSDESDGSGSPSRESDRIDCCKSSTKAKGDNHKSFEQSVVEEANNSLNLLNTSAANLSISDRIDMIRNHTKSSSIQVQNDPDSLKHQSNLFKLTSDIELDPEYENDDVADDDTYNMSSIHSDVVSLVANPESELPAKQVEQPQIPVETAPRLIEPSVSEETVVRDELTPEVVGDLVREISDSIFQCRRAGNPDDWKWLVVQERHSLTQKIFAYKRFLSDLISDLLPRIFRPPVPSPQSSTIKDLAKWARLLPFPQSQEALFQILHQRILTETQPLVRHKQSAVSVPDARRDGLVGRFLKSIRRESIDDLVLQEMVEENSQWFDYSAEVTSIIGYLGHDLTCDLIDDLIRDLMTEQLHQFKNV